MNAIVQHAALARDDHGRTSQRQRAGDDLRPMCLEPAESTWNDFMTQHEDAGGLEVLGCSVQQMLRATVTRGRVQLTTVCIEPPAPLSDEKMSRIDEMKRHYCRTADETTSTRL